MLPLLTAKEPGPPARARTRQSFLALSGLVLCLTGIWFSARIGLSRLFAAYGTTSRLLPAVNEAVRLSPLDPEAHAARARILYSGGYLTAAISELEQATSLEPRNFGYWGELANVYDLTGRAEEAIAAARRAGSESPFYAQPHWQLGNLLLRKGLRREAFVEFRRAMQSDSSWVPNVVDLAWGAFNGRAPEIEQALQPETALTFLELARVYAARGAIDDAMRLFRQASDKTGTMNDLREKLFSELFTAKRYPEAWEVWAVNHGLDTSHKGIAILSNSGFEKSLSIPETGFGWQFNPEKPAVSVSRDLHEPYAATASLKIEWAGKSYSSVYIASQIALIESAKHYQLNFAARTKELVTGGLPEVAVLSAYEGKVLAATSLTEGTSAWRTYSLKFTPPAESQIVVIVVRRQACSMMPCPAFGVAWFDAFELREVS